MLCIIEGSDGTGKSTLVEALRSRHLDEKPDTSVKVIHFGPPEGKIDGESAEEYAKRCADRFFEAMQDYDPQNFDDLWILDRAHIGSPVYGSLFRPDTNLDCFGDLGQEQFFRVERFFNSLCGYLVWLAPHPDTVVDRALARPDGEDEYLDSVSDSDRDKAEEREFQIRSIMSRYASFFRDVSQMLPTYPGHPFYVTKNTRFTYNGVFPILPASVLSDKTSYFEDVSPWITHDNRDSWPEIAYEQDVNKVADYILTRSVTVQLARHVYAGRHDAPTTKTTKENI